MEVLLNCEILPKMTLDFAVMELSVYALTASYKFENTCLVQVLLFMKKRKEIRIVLG